MGKGLHLEDKRRDARRKPMDSPGACGLGEETRFSSVEEPPSDDGWQ